jgi:alpha-glucosidase (family GH31 glycosyl hydrolase)
MLLENSEFGMFVRGGSILPIKMHRGALSLLRTKMNPIRLDIYLSTEGTATGRLYLDDGESFRYQRSLEQALIEYEFKDNKLTCKNILDSHYKYEAAQYLKIVEVNFYGMYRSPSRVKSTYRRRQYLDFEFIETKQALNVKNLNYPVDSDVRVQTRTIL